MQTRPSGLPKSGRISPRSLLPAAGGSGFTGSIVPALAAAAPERASARPPQGTHAYTMDPKGRVVCPKELIPVLGDPFILTRAPEQCLLAFSAKAWARLAKNHRGERVFGSYFRSGAIQVETDRRTASTPTGRFMLPLELRRHGGLHAGMEVVLVDLGAAVLLCARDRWDAHLAELERGIVAALASPRAELESLC